MSAASLCVITRERAEGDNILCVQSRIIESEHLNKIPLLSPNARFCVWFMNEYTPLIIEVITL